MHAHRGAAALVRAIVPMLLDVRALVRMVSVQTAVSYNRSCFLQFAIDSESPWMRPPIVFHLILELALVVTVCMR